MHIKDRLIILCAAREGGSPLLDELIIMNSQGGILFYNNYTDENCDSTFVSDLLKSAEE